MTHGKIPLLIILFVMMTTASLFSVQQYTITADAASGSLDIAFDTHDWNRTVKNNVNFKELYFQPFQHGLQMSVSFDYIHQLKRFDYKKKENPVRRVEILFFGSLTLISFLGWLFFSLLNVMIYEAQFGVLQREQILWLYIGSSVVSLSIAISDLFINLRPKLKKIEVY